MISPLIKTPIHFRERITHAALWHEWKWNWILEAVVFAILGLACAWPIVAAGGAMFEMFQRLTM
jgi:hypothetical protein